MTRRERLAAEYFGYSLANYAGHLEVENLRFTKLMPETVDVLERAYNENWPAERIAAKLEVKPSDVPDMLKDFRQARDIVDSPNSSEAFRLAVRQVLQNSVGTQMDDESIDDLVIRICNCAADLGCLLDWEGKALVDYSEWLRREKDIDYSGVGLPNLKPDLDETDE